MKKLVRGVLQYRQTRLETYRREFAHLALGQKPDALFICCSDSRVQPNIFASTDPGDLFVVRNVANIVPPVKDGVISPLGASEAAAIGFAMEVLRVRDVIICGHSGCGGMQTLEREAATPGSCSCGEIVSWLENARPLVEHADSPGLATYAEGLPSADRLSQRNVLLQLEHLMTYERVRSRVDRGELRLHGWWFNLATADVHVYDKQESRFCLLDENHGFRLLESDLP